MRSPWSAPISLAVLAACSSGGHFEPYRPAMRGPEPWPLVITNLDLLRVGQAQAERFVAALPAAERAATEAALARAASACVRVEVLTRSSGSNFQFVKGSGVAMRGKTAAAPVRVGTAGHVLADGGSTEVAMRSSGGEAIHFDASRSEYTLFGSSDQDWGIIELASPPTNTPALLVALPQQGELAFVLAYPDGVGRDEQGRMVYGKAAAADAPLQPVLTVAEVTQTAPLQLRPLAGAMPLGGASGGAIVNRRGELIGLFNAVVANFEGDGVTHWLQGASTAALRDDTPR